jgi:hypothetical protein
MLAMTVGTKEEKTIVSSNVTVSNGSPPPAPPKIGQTATGTCGTTSYSDDCSSQSSGAFNASADGITTLAQCVAKVKTCGKNGNFASFSLQNVRLRLTHASLIAMELVSCGVCGVWCTCVLP